ncbi:MAG: glycoside hydrolase [Candidatus Eisenbacteria bacterium]|uniref:Glycoside hydrolase n=1 Tax=Eiseniibacteriota bacterium TaxID=2212470 RepID=A0A849SR23_UNCEI|nr:glycoside hydrolase [Candidatus Eisenbacteria bacterium]
MLLGAVALAIASSLAVPAIAQKRIYIANDDHTDYFWSGDAAQYRSAFLSTLDYYMNQIESTAGNISDHQARYNMDCSLWLWEYERNKSATAYQRLIGHLRTGKLSMPLNPAVLCYGAAPAEAVLRGMYYAGRIERRESLRFPLVVAMENQTLPGGVASLWAGAGAQYSWRGVCGCASQTSWGNRPREIYHFNGPDGTGVCMKWNTMRGDNEGVGGYAEARDPSAAVDYLTSNSAFLASWPWQASAAFGYGWDDMQSTTSSFVSTAQSKANASRRVIVSNEVDFFEDFLANYSSQIPTFSGSFGNEWDLYSASMGEVTADFRRHIEKLRTAESMASVVSLFDAAFMTPRTTARDLAFMAAGLYYEHDWTADGPVSRSTRAQFQRDQLTNLMNFVNPLLADATTAIGTRIAQPGGTERHFVFNPLSWTRSEAADLPSTLAQPLHVIDVATGFQTPSQVIGSGSTQKVRILASDVPAVGYKVFEVRSGAGQSFPAAATVSGGTIDNGLYAVTLGASGAITSVVDHKDANRQLVESGGSMHNLGSGSGSITVEQTGPVSVTLRVVAGGSPAHETRVTLFAGLDRVDVEGTITANFSSNVSYDYRFNLAGATLRHEEIGMVAKVARAAQGGDYADQNTRTDWLSFGHFADFSTASRGVTLSNWDSPFFQAGNSTVTSLDGSTPRLRACVGMQVDGTGLGIQNQGGDSRFTNRFSIRTHGAYDPAAAMKFSLEHQNPFVAARVNGTSGSPLPATSWRLLDLPSNDVLLWALKPAEEGISQGLIARVWNLAEGSRSFTLALPSNTLTSARRTTHLETDLGAVTLANGAVSGSLARQQMATYRLFPGGLVIGDVTPPAGITDLRGP